MAGVPLAEIVTFLDGVLGVEETIDYPGALNGLQVDAEGPVRNFAVAVDASLEVIEEITPDADLLIVHHGLFWGGVQPLRGPFFHRIRMLIEAGTALYSAHLPLDGHAEIGNAILLARMLHLHDPVLFGSYRGTTVGSRGVLTPPRTLSEVRSELTHSLGGPVRVLGKGPEEIAEVGIVTGAGASLLPEAVALGLDLLITGEANHHHAIDATEMGIHLLVGGHYATEVFGVKALADIVTDRFGIAGRFVDAPTGL